jgi:hypothetical protein
MYQTLFCFIIINSSCPLYVAGAIIFFPYKIKWLWILIETFEYHSTLGLETTLKLNLGDLFLLNRDLYKDSPNNYRLES